MSSSELDAEYAKKAGDVEEQTTPANTIVETSSNEKETVEELAKREGVKLVEFEAGKGENPREWNSGKRWYVCIYLLVGQKADLRQVHHPRHIFTLLGGCNWKFNHHGRVSSIYFFRGFHGG